MFAEYSSPPRKKFRSYSERLNPESDIQQVSLDKLPENSSVYLTIDDEPVLLIRGEGEKVKAFGATCTHLDCLVGYNKSGRNITCNCHGSLFNEDGFPLEGPAKLPLKKYDAKIIEGVIHVREFINYKTLK